MGVSHDSIDHQTSTTAPVVLKNDTLFFLHNQSGGYPMALRMQGLNDRLERAFAAYNKTTDSIYVTAQQDFLKVMHNQQMLLAVTEDEASVAQISIEQLASDRVAAIKDAFSAKKELSTAAWAKQIGLFLGLLLLLFLAIKFINVVFSRLNKRLSKIERTFLNRKGNLLKYFIPGNSSNIFVFLVNVLRITLIVLLLIICAPIMFSFFPFTEHLAEKFYGYIEAPVKYVANGIIDFIPSLFFIVVIALTARYFVRVLGVITSDIEAGKLEIRKFHKDWAKPTGKLFSLLIYALALVLIFPYLPGSGSSAFQGVSIFIGAIISFGSTSAIANIIAGIVITYMRPFQIGDRVKIDNIVGDVIGKTILVTHLSTTKNEDVTIPNANILIGNIINYSSAKTGNIIVHTTVTLGYDLPWKLANELLLEAASRAPFLLKDQPPFVLQTSLDDFYVSYELNAYTEEFKKLPLIYSEIHKNILDVFDEAGVEILSPGYVAARDGGASTVPSQAQKASKPPFIKLVDYLTGRNQPNQISPGQDT